MTTAERCAEVRAALAAYGLDSDSRDYLADVLLIHAWTLVSALERVEAQVVQYEELIAVMDIEEKTGRIPQRELGDVGLTRALMQDVIRQIRRALDGPASEGENDGR